ALLDGFAKARPSVPEPDMVIAVTEPAADMGDVTGDLSSRRGRVSNPESVSGDMLVITGQVPLAEMEDYQSSLKSMTGGEGSFELAFSTYEPAPADVQKRLMEAYRQPEED